MQKSEIELLLRENGVNANNIYFTDEKYSVPLKSWFFNEFAQSLGVLYNALGTTKYRPESNDCDNFSAIAAAWSQILNNRTQEANKQTPSALTVGEFWYYQSNGGAHAIICAIVGASGGRELVFMEPQLGGGFVPKQVFLNRDEKWLCQFIKF